MNDLILSKDTDYILCFLYEYYRFQRNKGNSKSEAMRINHETINSILSDFNKDDVHEALYELKSSSLIKMDILGNVELLSNAIIFMEQRPKRELKELINFLTSNVPQFLSIFIK